jgi:hypothetical protein
VTDAARLGALLLEMEREFGFRQSAGAQNLAEWLLARGVQYAPATIDTPTGRIQIPTLTELDEAAPPREPPRDAAFQRLWTKYAALPEYVKDDWTAAYNEIWHGGSGHPERKP